MKKLFERHYQAIVKCGLIDDDTTILDFAEKIAEEQLELQKELFKSFFVGSNNLEQEAIDLVCSTINMLVHFGYDIEQELLKNIETQEKRANEKNNTNKD